MTLQWALIGVLLILISYVPYWLSIPGHIANGDAFKSLFDVYRDKLAMMGPASTREQRRWRAVWNQLQHGVSAPKD